MRWLARNVVRVGKALVDMCLSDTAWPIGTNLLGIAVFLAAFGPAVAIMLWLPTAKEGPLVMLGGAIGFALDAGLRKALGHESLLELDRRPRLVFMPLWLWGLLWILVGAIQSLWALLA
jgi:hypothetical protein